MNNDKHNDKSFEAQRERAEKARPHTQKIYEQLFPGCQCHWFTPLNQEQPHEFDKNYGIDVEIILPDEQVIFVQEKIRDFDAYVNPRIQVNPPSPDFTQEYMNGVGTPYEAPGEWYHLKADYYLYGWWNENETDIIDWKFFDVYRYKRLIQNAGDLKKIGGQYHLNTEYGNKSSFYAISFDDLDPVVVADKNNPGIHQKGYSAEIFQLLRLHIIRFDELEDHTNKLALLINSLMLLISQRLPAKKRLKQKYEQETTLPLAEQSQ